MDVNLQRKPAKNRNNLINSKYELPFELDSTMPDYCRDVEKILNTGVYPVICSVTCSESKLIVDGNNLITVFYLDNENNISKYESKVPFSKTIEMKTIPQNPIVNTKAYEGYINCRAVSPRRLDIRGTVVIEVEVNSNENDSLIEDVNCDDMEVMKKTFDGAEFIGQYTKQFTIKEDLNINDKNCTPSYIIRYNICPMINEYKILPDKTIIKGDLNATICYCSENNKQIVTKDFKIPFSQIIDCPNIDENCICDSFLKIINSEVMYSAQEDGSCDFNICATLCANITGYKKVNITAVTDCFCHSCDCICKTKNLNIMKIVSVLNNSFTHTETVNVDECTDIKDSWCKPVSTEYEYEKGSLKVKLRAIICVLGVKNNQYCCIEKPVVITLEVLKNQNIESPCFCPHINIIGCKYTDINNSKVDIICNIKVNGIVFDKINVNVIDDIKPDEKVKKPINQDLVIIHYVHVKESLWDIAKRYNTSVKSIKEQNNLNSDYSEIGQTLIITPFKTTIQSEE